MDTRFPDAKSSIFDADFDFSGFEPEEFDLISKLRAEHATRKPVSPPDSHKARTITIIGPHAHAYRPGFRKFKLQKRYRYANPDHHPTQPKGTWDGQQGTNGGWEEMPAEVGITRHTSREIWLDELRDFVDLHEHLRPQDLASIVLGRPKDDARNTWSRGGWNIPSRSHAFYGDFASCWFPIDIDNLGCAPEDAEHRIKDFISEVMPEHEGAAYVAAHSGSSGIKGTRVRIWLQLAEPRTLRDMAAYVAVVAKRVGPGILDPSIYSPGHLLLSAAPKLYADVADGSDVREETASRPVHGNAWYSPGDLANIPAAVASASAPSTADDGERLTKASAEELLANMAPGSYDKNVNRYICHAAWCARSDRIEQDFANAVAAIRERITATSDAARLHERLNKTHGNADQLRLKWNKSRERLRLRIESTELTDTSGIGMAASTSVPAATQDIHAARMQLPVEIDRLTKEALDGKPGLLISPPGCGKTTTLLDQWAQPGIIYSERRVIAVPTHELAKQLHNGADKLARERVAALGHDPDVGYLGGTVPVSDAVLHVKGRGEPGMCTDPVYGPRAKAAEEAGIPFRKHVCAHCPSKPTCKLMRQDQLIEPSDGSAPHPMLIICTHEMLARLGARLGHSIAAIDESPLNTLFDSAAFPLSTLLRSGTVKSRAKGQAGTRTALKYESQRLKDWRAALVNALKARVPQEDCADVPTCLLEGIDLADAIALEEQLQETLEGDIGGAIKNGRKFDTAADMLKASHWAMALYKAAQTDRAKLAGVALYRENKVAMVKLVTLSETRMFDKPTLMLDGTASELVWRAMLKGGAGSIATVAASIPTDCVRVIQHADQDGSKSSLLSKAQRMTEGELEREAEANALKLVSAHIRELALGPDAAVIVQNKIAAAAIAAGQRATRKKRADSKLEMVRMRAMAMASDHDARAVDVDGRKVSLLLVGQKEVLLQLAKDGLTPNIAMAHFGALRGLNKFENMPACMVVGRMRPPNADVELMAEALFAYDPAVTVARYQVEPPHKPWTRNHPDPYANEVLMQLCGAELLQAVARLRLHNRTAANPCELRICNAWDCGLPDDAARRPSWFELAVSPAELALRYGPVFDDPRLNHGLYPKWFPRAAANKGGGTPLSETRKQFNILLDNLARNWERKSASKSPALDSVLTAYRDSGKGSLEPANAGASASENEGDSGIPISDKYGIADVHQQPTFGAAAHASAVGSADALDFDGASSVAGRLHKVVEFKGGGVSRRTRAIIPATTGRADLERMLGVTFTHWRCFANPAEAANRMTLQELAVHARAMCRTD